MYQLYFIHLLSLFYLTKYSCGKNADTHVILYQSGELSEHIEVRLGEDTVWLNRIQLATLFGRDVKTIGKHLANVFSEGELEKDSTVANFATVQIEGCTTHSKSTDFKRETQRVHERL